MHYDRTDGRTDRQTEDQKCKNKYIRNKFKNKM
jgi:hypothetical protein